MTFFPPIPLKTNAPTGGAGGSGGVTASVFCAGSRREIADGLVADLATLAPGAPQQVRDVFAMLALPSVGDDVDRDREAQIEDRQELGGADAPLRETDRSEQQ